MSDYNLAFFCSVGAHLVANALYFIVEGSLLIKVSHLVSVSLALKVVSLLGSEGLPLLANLLHHLQGSHFWVRIDYEGPCLSG